MSNPTKPFPGLSLASLRKHPALIPLFACTAAGAVWAGFYIWRLSTKCPDVSWNKKPEPWHHYKDKQYKFYSPTIDYSKLEYPKERPKLD